MHQFFIVTALILSGCASSLKKGDDNFASTYRALANKDFATARENLGKAEWERVGGKKPFVYFDREGNKQHIDSYTMYNTIRFLRENTMKCEKIAQEPEFDIRFFEEYCTKDGLQGEFIKSQQKFSKVSLKPLIFDNHPRYLSVVSKIDAENMKTHQAWLKENETKEGERLRLKKLSKDPRYRKCKLQSDLIDSKKMLKLWNRNINELKNDAKRAGQMTYKMEKNMNKSLSLVRTYKLKIKDTNKKLSKASTINVTETSCKKMIPNYGMSNADQYL